jgi:hypothetical protein
LKKNCEKIWRIKKRPAPLQSQMRERDFREEKETGFRKLKYQEIGLAIFTLSENDSTKVL